MKHLTIILLLAACQPQPVVTPIPKQSMSRQELDFQARADAAWDAAEESRKRVLQQYKQECFERWGNVAECKRYEGVK